MSDGARSDGARLTMINLDMILPHSNMENGPGTIEFERLLRDFQSASDQPIELEKFTKLLDGFNGLPKLERRRPRTLLQVAGFPHRELPYSNILAFLLDQKEEHGMGDLVLRSLLEAAEESELRASLPAKMAKVTREDPTEGKKRIDIVVETESFVLGIENKIFAGIVNPFKAYNEHLETKAKENGKQKLWRGILLSLHEEAPDTTLCGFRRVAYEELFVALRRNLGFILSSATPKHVFYLLDFIETLENLKRRNDMMDAHLIEFFREHGVVAHRFHLKTEELRGELKWRGRQMKDVRLPNDTLRLKSEELPDQFCWDTWFEIDLGVGVKLGVQAALKLQGWEISTYAWYDKGCEKNKDWVEGLMKVDGFSLGKWQSDAEGEGGIWVYKAYPYEERDETVRSKFQELIDLVFKHLPTGWKGL